MKTRFKIRQPHIIFTTQGALLETFEGGKTRQSFIGNVNEKTLREFAAAHETRISETTEFKEQGAR